MAKTPKFDQETTMGMMGEVQTSLRDYAPTVKQSLVVDGQARYVRWDFTKLNLPSLELLQITDIQFGHKQCNVEKLYEYIAWVLAEPQRYVVLGGDLVDAGHVQSKGSPFEQIGDPQEEIWSFVKLIAPIRHRVLGYVGGNHERRSIATFGDLGRSISTILRVPYSPGKQHLDICFGKHNPFKITMHHSGPGGGGTIGGVANSLQRLMSQSDSQLFLSGHLHQALTIPASKEVRDGKGGMKLIKVVGARGSSFLKYYGTYAEVIMSTTPQDTLMPRVVLEKNGKWEVTLR
jgi:Calcineurin-like phosphoesterase